MTCGLLKHKYLKENCWYTKHINQRFSMLRGKEFVRLLVQYSGLCVYMESKADI